MSNVKRHPLEVSRRAPTITVRIDQRFGTHLGDVRHFQVARAGPGVTISASSTPRTTIDVSVDVAQELRDALTEVLDWVDDDGSGGAE